MLPLSERDCKTKIDSVIHKPAMFSTAGETHVSLAARAAAPDL